MEDRVRLDKLLVDRGLVPSRERARTLIERGGVSVNGRTISKASTIVSCDADINLTEEDIPWVSRAGIKLAHAFATWPIDVVGKTCLDVGASTGGFTDVLIAHGATKVYALDVGHGQLAERLRIDPRVVNLEGIDIRTADIENLPVPFTCIVVDVSFISLKLVLPHIVRFLAPGGDLILLVKPQFEVGRSGTQRGIVRDPRRVDAALKKIISLLPGLGVAVVGATPSPIVGMHGNTEFLIYGRKQ